MRRSFQCPGFEQYRQPYTKGHKEEVEHQFQGFLLTKDADLQVATAKSIFSLLYDELDKRFNEEISEDCSDTHKPIGTLSVFFQS